MNNQEIVSLNITIIHKSEIQEIVHGAMIDFGQIQLFCNEESIITKRTKIGFGYAHD